MEIAAGWRPVYSWSYPGDTFAEFSRLHRGTPATIS